MGEVGRPLVAGMLAICLLETTVAAAPPSAQQILTQFMQTDPWGLSGAELTGKMVVRCGGSLSKRLAFSLTSHVHDPPLAKVIVRITEPADEVGIGYLLVQHRTGDDERFIFIPQLGRTQRVSANQRADNFLGSGFSFADLDRRDLRDGTAVLVGEERVEQMPAYHLDIDTRRPGSPYAHIEVWISTETFLPLRMVFYDRDGRKRKQLVVERTHRVAGHWFVTKSQMLSLTDQCSTELIVDRVAPVDETVDDDFTVRALEKP